MLLVHKIMGAICTLGPAAAESYTPQHYAASTVMNTFRGRLGAQDNMKTTTQQEVLLGHCRLSCNKCAAAEDCERTARFPGNFVNARAPGPMTGTARHHLQRLLWNRNVLMSCMHAEMRVNACASRKRTVVHASAIFARAPRPPFSTAYLAVSEHRENKPAECSDPDHS